MLQYGIVCVKVPSLPDNQPSEAFIRALTDSQPALRGYCQASLGHGEEAKEALQRTSIVLWRKCGDWDPAMDFMRWAISVAKFEVLGVVRDRNRQHARFVFDPDVVELMTDEAAQTTSPRADALELCLGNPETLLTQNGEPMNLDYAGALQKWLDAAQGAGRIEEGNPLVTELRSQTASAQGNQSAVVKQMSQLPWLKQGEAARDYAKGLQTPAAQKQAMEELSTALHIQNFPHFVNALAAEQGFDAAREILNSAVLTPEKHDLAAASIAAANIGPDTPAKAKWLLESLRSEDKRAIVEFTDQWAHADYQGAAQWLGALPAGKQRDTAISGFVPAAAKIDGATAVDWALTLTDPAERCSCVDDVVRKWKETDAEAAIAYLKEKGLPVK